MQSTRDSLSSIRIRDTGIETMFSIPVWIIRQALEKI